MRLHCAVAVHRVAAQWAHGQQSRYSAADAAHDANHSNQIDADVSPLVDAHVINLHTCGEECVRMRSTMIRMTLI